MPHGKQPNHKLKPYVVFQYLLKYTDENHVAPASDIVAFLEECGLNAERRSIYEDIKEINLISLMMENDCTLEEAREMLEEDVEGEERIVVYDPHRKGFYVRQRHFDLNDIRLLAECVYSAKFVTKGQADRLVDVVCDFVSEHQAERIKHNVFLTDRVKTSNKGVMNNIATINDAMSRRLDGKSHKPEKISFKYLKHTIGDMSQQVERRKGEQYVVSPYQLLISDGNYYLLAYVNEKQKMRTYRVDRMKNVTLTGEPREGDDEFAKLDVQTYAQRVFGMYGGKQTRVTIQFINLLLDISFSNAIISKCKLNAEAIGKTYRDNSERHAQESERLLEQMEAEGIADKIRLELQLSSDSLRNAIDYFHIGEFCEKCQNVLAWMNLASYVLLFLSMVLSPYIVRFLSGINLNCITLWSLAILYFDTELKGETTAKVFSLLAKSYLNKNQTKE